MELLSKVEQKQLVSLLSKLEPGFYPPEVFYALVRLIVTTTFLIVPLYFDKELYVHLIKREDTDPHWPGLLHVPGTVVLQTDKSIDDVYSRLCEKEVSELNIQGGPVFCGYVFDQIPRGKEVSLIHYVLLRSKPSFGALHKVNSLPENVIPTEVKRIHMAAQKYNTDN